VKQRNTSPGRHLATGAVVAGAALVAIAGALLLAGCSGDDAPKRTAEEQEYWGDPGGRWHEGGWRELTTEQEASLTPEQIREIERLRSIGYLTGSTAPPANVGVTVYDRALTYEGLNFYTSGHMPGAILMDMKGEVLHDWKYAFIDAWDAHPGEELPPNNKSIGYWRRAYPFPNGDVIAIFEGVGIIKVDRDSNLLWASFNSAHHDLDVTPDGTIYTLTRRAHMLPRISEQEPVLEDFITTLDEDGNELHSFSLLEAFENSPFAEMLEGMAPGGDIFHTNTIEILGGTLEGQVPGFRRGNALVSMRELGVIAVVDIPTERVVWAIRGDWVAQHQPTVLPDGNIMLFDNRGNRGGSRVIVFDPRTRQTLWVYGGIDPASFFSNECGSCDVLPNGNVLITESDRGKAFEVMQDKTIVWKYINPAQAGDDRQFVATLFEVIRLDKDYGIEWRRRRR
jgi:hypothetical protein